jgi:two-component system NtrC family response regulator
MMQGKILIIDDEEQLRKILKKVIALEGYEVFEAGTLKAASEFLHHKIADVILCDVKLPDGNGIDYVRGLKKQFPLTEVILLTAYGNIADGVLAIKNGAFDYITKGNDNDRIIPLLSQAMDRVMLNKKGAVKINGKSQFSFSDIIGGSSGIRHAVSLAQKIASSNTTVLLLGETGTGKEVFANAIHYSGNRNLKSFVAINCSAFTRDLLEGELFGHKAGAYTGAVKDRKGLFELADGGTLFLDEIGEMNIELQAKLLRVLENGEFNVLGDSKTTTVDVRIIAATNRDLNSDIVAGNFREDLFYRLNVFTIPLPALRERLEDIQLLAAYFLDYFSKKENRQPFKLSKDALNLLEKHAWNGNIRELRNVMERSVILAEGSEILPQHLPYEIQKQNEGPAARLSLSSVEKSHIEKVMNYSKGNKTKTAEVLGIGLATLYRKLEEYHITVNK